MLAWLSVWSEVQTCIWPSWCRCHSLSLASVKSRLVFPFWYWLTWVVPDKGPLSGCKLSMYNVCLALCVWYSFLGSSQCSAIAYINSRLHGLLDSCTFVHRNIGARSRCLFSRKLLPSLVTHVPTTSLIQLDVYRLWCHLVMCNFFVS